VAGERWYSARMSRFALASVAAVVVVLAAGCPRAVECGGLSSDAPSVDAGKGKATRSDGADFTNEAASWESGGSASVDVGVLDMIIAKDATGTDFDSLVADGALPICIPQAARSDTSGAANLVEGGFVTDATHTGNVLVISVDADNMLGRFAMELVSPDGTSTLTFSDGEFNAARR
jgi:hypothetical protein